jgi:hypothetical protein
VHRGIPIHDIGDFREDPLGYFLGSDVPVAHKAQANEQARSLPNSQNKKKRVYTAPTQLHRALQPSPKCGVQVCAHHLTHKP